MRCGKFGARGEESESISMINALLEHGSYANDTYDFGRSVFHRIRNNTNRELYVLLLQYGADVNLPDINGETPFHFAASAGNTAYSEWLLEQGADIGALDRENRTPLHAAAYHDCSSSVEWLIEHGADVHLADKHGWLPLHFAAAQGQSTIFEVLLQNGSDITAVDNKGRTVLHLAVKYGWTDFQFVGDLVGHGCDINARDFCGQIVFGASQQPNFDNFATDFLRIFLENGGDIHALDLVTGRATLHVVAPSSLISAVDRHLGRRTRHGDKR